MLFWFFEDVFWVGWGSYVISVFLILVVYMDIVMSCGNVFVRVVGVVDIVI